MKLRKGMGLFDVISDCPHTSVTSGCKKPWNFLSRQLFLHQPFLHIDANDVKQYPTLTLNALRVEDLLLLLFIFLQVPCVVVAKNEWLVWV